MNHTTATPAATDRCPRCGDSFHCGMADSGPCACTTVILDEPTQAALRTRYSGCLCLRCLMELGSATDPSLRGC